MTDAEARTLKPGDRVFWHRPALLYPLRAESVESSVVLSVSDWRGMAGVTLDPPMDRQTILANAIPSRCLERSEGDVWRALYMEMRRTAREPLARALEYRQRAREVTP